MVNLSFIVPVYNVEKYLRKCVFSLVHQDFKNYEVILVDDGSTDGSGKICDELSETIRDERLAIRVIHQKNGGLSVARNAGLKVAQGEYVCFVDSDDYWEENVLGELMAQVERDKLDVLRFKYQNVNERFEVFNPNKSNPYRNDNYSGEVTDGVSFLNSRFGTACYAVMFIIRRELLDDCLFTEGIYFEDTDWTPRMLCKAKHVASTDTVVYNYFVRQGSISRAVNREKQQKVLDDKIRLVQELQRQAEALRKSGRYNRWYKEMISDVVVSIISILSVDFYDERDQYLEQVLAFNLLPIQPRSMKARMINISPRLAVELLHIKNR